MPKTKRDYLRRDMACAQLELIAAGEYLASLEQTFRPVHPEQADILSSAIQGILVIVEVNTSFCDFVWGHHPDNWEDWRGQSRQKFIPDNNTGSDIELEE
jgi:hypothetical protein